MAPLLHLTPLQAAYPSRLRGLPQAPAALTTQGGPLEAAQTVAIVGSRKATVEARRFAHELAAALVHGGVVVVSGGALGVDAAAHEGALDAGGRTWVIAGTGCHHLFPPEHRELFQRIAAGPGAMVWPFPPEAAARPGGFLLRNRVLVALSDAVVVVQAGARSGALAAAACARKLGTPLWVAPAPPDPYAGSRRLLDEGARLLSDTPAFLSALPQTDQEGARSIGLVPPAPPVDRPRDGDEGAILTALTDAPCHVDAIAKKAYLSAQAATVALLTLALEAVVVEGPPGFFRRQGRSNK